MTIGEKIRFFRERKGFSQADMATLLNMSVQGYGNIERGETDLSYSRLELISKELDLTPEQLVGWGEKNHLVNSNHNNFLSGQNNHIYSDIALAHENEKLRLQNEHLLEKITFLEEKIKLLEKNK